MHIMVGESGPSRKDQFPLHFERVWDCLVDKVCKFRVKGLSR